MSGIERRGVAKRLPDTWATLVEEYVLAEKAVGRPKTTISTRRSHVARTARALGVAPDEVTATMLVRWFGTQDQWKQETRRGYYNSLLSFFSWARRNGHVETNPMSGVGRVKPGKPSPKPAPDRVWNEALAAASKRTAVMLHLAAHAGARRAEVAVVNNRTDLIEGFDGWSLRLHGKGSKDRVVPISDELAAMVAAGAAGHTPGASPSGWLFPGNDEGHLSPRYVGTLCSRALPGIWTMHKLRHRFATRAMRGSNLRVVQELLGHESLATTQIYTFVTDEELRVGALAATYRPGAA